MSRPGGACPAPAAPITCFGCLLRFLVAPILLPAGVLPDEWFVYFILTNMLFLFSAVMLLSKEDRDGFEGLMASVCRRIHRKSGCLTRPRSFKSEGKVKGR